MFCRQQSADGRGEERLSMLSLATCCLSHSKSPFLPTLHPKFPSPHSSPSPVDRAGISSHLPNTFPMLSLILHRQHLEEQKQTFSYALSCVFYKKHLEMPFLSGWDGRDHAMAAARDSPREAWSCAQRILCKSLEAGIWHCHGLVLYLGWHIYTPMSFFICYVWKAAESCPKLQSTREWFDYVTAHMDWGSGERGTCCQTNWH